MASSLTQPTNVRTSALTGHKTAFRAPVSHFQAQEATLSLEPAKTTPVASDSSDAKMFIYLKESGNNPGAINKSSGACGLGQALPCSKMPCSLSDYACQDNFFTQYMLNRYGTWDNAKSFWLSRGWW